MIYQIHKHVIVVLLVVSALFARISISLPYEEVRTGRDAQYAVFSGTELFSEPGQPNLPVYSCGVLLPPDADLNTVTFSIKGLQEENIGTYVVKPALPLYSINGPNWPQDRNIVDGKDMGVYSRNSLFPNKHVAVAGIGRLNCVKVVAVRINLARYNPQSKELVRMKAGELIVDFKNEVNYNRSRNRSLKIPLSNKKRAKAYVVNYDEFADAYDTDFTFIRNSKMVIMTTAAIESASKNLDALIASKANRGIEVQVITESTWGGNASGIRKWLQDNYQEQGLEYVLFIGDNDDVPMMTFPKFNGSKDCPSQWPYVQLDGSDFKSDKTCEIHSGRIPVYNNDIKELDEILAKTIAYESVGPDDIAWRKNILLCGPGYNSGKNTACVPMNAAYDKYIEPTPGWTAYRMYGDRWDDPVGDFDEDVGQGSSSSTKIIGKWKESQFGVIDWATHGSATSAQDIIASSQTSQIGNDYPGFVLCASCSNAKPSNSNNLSYAVLRDCGMGAIGGTDLTYYGGNYETSGSNNGWMYKYPQYMVTDTMTMGEALTALREFAPNYDWKNRGPFVLYGDPSIGVTSCNREPFISVLSPNGKEEWEQGKTYEIKWGSNVDGNVKIELLKGGAVDKTLAADNPNSGMLEVEVQTSGHTPFCNCRFMKCYFDL